MTYGSYLISKVKARRLIRANMQSRGRRVDSLAPLALGAALEEYAIEIIKRAEGLCVTNGRCKLVEEDINEAAYRLKSAWTR